MPLLRRRGHSLDMVPPILRKAPLGLGLLGLLLLSSPGCGNGVEPEAEPGEKVEGSGGSEGAGSATGESSSSGGQVGSDGTPGAGVDLGTGGEITQGAGGSTGGSQPEFGEVGDGRFEIGPGYTTDPDVTDRGAPRGKEFTFIMNSEDSAIFRGDDATLNNPASFTRSITVYVPDQYVDGTEAPLLIHHDGTWHFDLVKRALDNLTISADPDRRLPPFIAIAVNNGGGDSKGSQRGLEYDTMSDRLARFIEEEVLPAVLSNADIRAEYPALAFTSDPWGRATMGCSSGGAAALTMAWFRPDLFRRVITYSGTFVDQQDDDAPEEEAYPYGAWEYHDEQELIANTDPKPLRVFLHVSENDLLFGNGYHDWRKANEQTYTALSNKGYHARFLYAAEAGHCDDKVFNQTVADTLVWAWRGYPAE